MNDKFDKTVRSRAEKKAVERLASTKGLEIFRETHRYYTIRPEQNLIPGVRVDDFWSDLGAGAGNELVDGSREPAKFCAAFSSSALAVNVFGPFRNRPQDLTLLGCSGFSEAQFEKTLPTGLRGTYPHLDFYAASPTNIVCVESKFLETLYRKEAKFADTYSRAIESLAEPSWANIYRELKDDPRLFKYLDAAQLVKHYLGIQYTLENVDTELFLFYIYWEPTNADDFSEHKLHHNEVAQFKAAVNDSRVSFIALSYSQLWDTWGELSTWRGMNAHLSRIRQRYSFSI